MRFALFIAPKRIHRPKGYTLDILPKEIPFQLDQPCPPAGAEERENLHFPSSGAGPRMQTAMDTISLLRPDILAGSQHRTEIMHRKDVKVVLSV